MRHVSTVHAQTSVGKRMYAGVFVVTLAMLMHEILLTRIFSVTMFYHFAFLAVSVAMFGLTAGSVIVYLFPDFFTADRAKRQMAASAALLALSIPISFLMHLSIPFRVHISLVGIFAIVFNYSILAVPYVLSGIFVCLALTKFPRHVSRLYAADLIGAACGCILLIEVLEVTDGPTAVIVVAVLTGLGAILVAAEGGFLRLRRFATWLTVVLAAVVIANTAWIQNKGVSILRPIWVKGEVEPVPLYEKWNSYSRIIVFGDPDEETDPIGWNISEVYAPDQKIKQLRINIDADAATVLTAYDGNTSIHDYLKYDLTNIAHFLRPNSDVCVIGVGGGRDLLSALVFNQKSVLGIEINHEIIQTVNDLYGDFTGHLDRDPRVTFVNDEARSYITRQERKFDIIESSFIDSWAATAAGAFVLTENALYTAEAWDLFLQRLTPKGILTFTRWYDESRPDEIYRLTSLARGALLHNGAATPRDHIVIVRKDTGATILVSPSPFSKEDIATIDRVTKAMNFQVLLSPDTVADPTLATLSSADDLSGFFAAFPDNITAPTDDSPFFFNMVRFGDMFNWNRQSGSVFAMTYFLLGILLATVGGLSLMGIILPILIRKREPMPSYSWPFLVYFAAIGLGFMFIEISLMQKLIIFLGHPTYALSVVLFSLLLASGIGSFLVAGMHRISYAHADLICLALLLAILIFFGYSTPFLTTPFRAASNVTRVLIATAILFPLGVFMGMAFPLGMQRVAGGAHGLAPWVFGINGAMSIFASVVSVIISLGFGISATFWTGVFCYLAAAGSYGWIKRKAPPGGMSGEAVGTG